MLKPQDVVLLLKLLIKDEIPWTQPSIAAELYLSASEVNAGIKRLKNCNTRAAYTIHTTYDRIHQIR